MKSFDRAAENLKRAGALCLAFLLPSSGAQMQKSVNANAQPGHTYWQYKDARVVLDLWECPETGLCAQIHSVDVHDAGAIKMAKFLWQRDGKFGHPVGPVSDADVAEVCGYPQVFRNMKKLSGSRAGDFHFKGTAIYHALIDLPNNSGTSNGADIEKKDENLTIKTYIYHVWPHADELTQVFDPPPACMAPLPHLQFK